MLGKVAIGIGICMVTWVSALPAATKGKLDQIDRLLASGEHERALDKVRRLREALPSSERLTAWELDFRGEVLRVAVTQPHSAETLPNDRLFVYDVRAEQTKEVEVGDYWFLAPDESRRLRPAIAAKRSPKRHSSAARSRGRGVETPLFRAKAPCARRSAAPGALHAAAFVV
jgi:hypothetical protein